jgi:two-component system OmpR family sensor kinase
MNRSLRRQLLLWLSVSISVAALVAAAASAALSFVDASDLQDTQLEQVATLLSSAPLAPAAKFVPRDEEDAESHFVVKALGAPLTDSDPEIDVTIPSDSPSGIQTLDQRGVRWRVFIPNNPVHQRFAVAQRMTIRDEIARDSALNTLIPILLIIPILLGVVNVVLNRTFAPMSAFAQGVDRIDGSNLVELDTQQVPLESLPFAHAVNRLLRRLESALKQQRRLVSDAAHELRTPVAALVVQADNLGTVLQSEEGQSRMQTLRQGLVRMSSLLDQLLSLARLQGTAPLMRQHLGLHELARTAIEESLPMAQAKGIDLGCVVIEPTTIVGDALHAYALVRNVVENAVRYTPNGGVVDVSVSRDGDMACLVVEDTGPGISADDAERIFQPFVRVLGSNESGSGLGLAIVRTAADALGGNIELTGRTDRRSGLRFVYRQLAA